MDELFCEICHNILTIQVMKESKETTETDETPETQEEIQKLYYICNVCNIHNEKKDSNNSVFHLNYNLDDIKREHRVNPYTSFDPTLPKASGIKCPNENCPSGTKKSDIRYIKYDDKSMKYIYICLDCKNKNIEPNLWYL